MKTVLALVIFLVTPTLWAAVPRTVLEGGAGFRWERAGNAAAVSANEMLSLGLSWAWRPLELAVTFGMLSRTTADSEITLESQRYEFIPWLRYQALRFKGGSAIAVGAGAGIYRERVQTELVGMSDTSTSEWTNVFGLSSSYHMRFDRSWGGVALVQWLNDWVEDAEPVWDLAFRVSYGF